MDYFVWDINPIFFSISFVKIRWYGLMFALAFISSYSLMSWIYKREDKNPEEVDDLLWYMAIGTIVGARLGHCLLYDPSYYLSHPLKIFAIWEGGLASHGGIVGIIIALYVFQSRKKITQSYVWFLDRMAVACALGAGFIRTGNFFNSEIVGVPTTVPWAVIFKRIDLQPRHPVQIYEALSYLLVFIILFYLYRNWIDKIRPGVIFASSLVGIFIARFFLEFVKTKQAAYSNDFGLSTGQLLSLPFMLAGLLFIVYSFFKKQDN